MVERPMLADIGFLVRYRFRSGFNNQNQQVYMDLELAKK